MAGGTFTTQNKIRPGVYINFNSEPKPVGTLGDRGIVTMALPLSWGPSKTVIQIDAGEDPTSTLGYDITHSKLLLVREALKRAKTLLLYRLNTGIKAAATHTDLIVTALYGGERGNDLSIVIQKNIDDHSKYDVKTLVAGVEADLQTVSSITELISNQWVVFSGSGDLEETAGLPLTGGLDGVVTNGDHSDYHAAIEVHDFNTMALLSTESSLKSVYASFIKRLRDEEGQYVQLVVENYPMADYEGIISVKNGVILADGSKLSAAEATAWVAGASAGANVNESLTYQAYDDAVDVEPRYTHSQIEAAIQNGEFLFTQNNGRAVVEYDINTFTSYQPEKDKRFSKNRVIRTRDGLANDFKHIFERYYIGKINNNADGRNLFKAECINQVELYQSINAIQNLNAQTDIDVLQGDDNDTVVIALNIQEVDSAEKIYMRVRMK